MPYAGEKVAVLPAVERSSNKLLHLCVLQTCKSIPKPIKSCKSVSRTIDFSVDAYRLKTLIVNDNKLTCISLHHEERGSEHQEQNEGE